MQKEQFIKIDELFVHPSTTTKNYYYLQQKKTKWINNDWTNRQTNNFQKLVLIDMLDKECDKQICALECHYDAMNTAPALYKNTDFTVIYGIIKEALKHKTNKAFPKGLWTECMQELEKVAQEKLNFLNKYGVFHLEAKKHFLNEQDVNRLANLENDISSYTSNLEQMNKKIENLAIYFKEKISPYVAEKYAHTNYKIKSYKEENRTITYVSLNKWDLFLPVILFPVKSQEFISKIEHMKKENLSMFDSLNDDEHQNAQKKLKGYALYYPKSPRYKQDGFLTSDKTVVPNILMARIFETSEQAKLHSINRRAGKCAVIEVDFVFSKVVVSEVDMGPCMQSLMAIRDKENIQEILAPKEEVSEIGVSVKKHKI